MLVITVTRIVNSGATVNFRIIDFTDKLMTATNCFIDHVQQSTFTIIKMADASKFTDSINAVDYYLLLQTSFKNDKDFISH